MPSEQHEQQNTLAARWAKAQGFPVVATNVIASGSRERVDVIAFRQSCSLLIESKISRGDFIADARKPERTAGGAGLYRFYVTPPGLITPSELPLKWGLLEAKDGKAVMVKGPTGNAWSPAEWGHGDWADYQHVPDLGAERAILFSITRRLADNKIHFF